MLQTTSAADMILVFIFSGCENVTNILMQIFQISNTNNLNARKQIQFCGPAA